MEKPGQLFAALPVGTHVYMGRERALNNRALKSYLRMRKTHQLDLAGVFTLFPVLEDPLDHTVREGREDFNPLDK